MTASWPRCWRGLSGSTAGASSRITSMPKPASISPSFSARSGRIASGRSAGRASPTSRSSGRPSVRTSVSRTRRAPLAGGGEPGAERRQQPVDAGEHVRLEPDRLGKGQPQREDVLRPRRRDRLGGAAERLVEPARHRRPEPPGELRPRQRRQIGDPAEAERLQRRDLGGVEPERRHRQRADMGDGLARRHDAAEPRRSAPGRPAAGRRVPSAASAPASGWRAPPGRWRRRHGRPRCRRRRSAPPPRRRRGCRRGRAGAVRPKSAASASTRAASVASPPKRWAQPVMSRTSASSSSATQGLKRPAQRRSAARKSAVRRASSGRVTRSGQMARASPSAMPRRSPTASAGRLRLASSSAPRTSPMTASGCSASCGSARSVRSAARRGNQRERMRRCGTDDSGLSVLYMFRSYRSGGQS